MSNIDDGADLGRHMRNSIDQLLPAAGAEDRALRHLRQHAKAAARASRVGPAWLQGPLATLTVALLVIVLLGGTLVWTLGLRGRSSGPAVPPPKGPTAPVQNSRLPALNGVEASVPPLPGTTPEATPSSIDYVEPISVSFPDARDGWLLGQGCDTQQRCTAVMARTGNGGATWALVTTPMRSLSSAWASHVTAASATDSWVWGGNDGPPLLTATHDGGRSWQPVSAASGAISGVAVDRGTVWAVVHCGDTSASSTCVQVIASPVHGGAWSQLAALPAPAQAQPDQQNGIGDPPLVRRSGRAWVLDGDFNHPALARSDDGGRSWVSITLPCQQFSVTMAASSASNLVIACVRAGGWPAPQEVWSSNDGGSHWSLRSRANQSWQGPRFNDVGSLPNGGAPVDLAMIDSNTTWMANDREDDLVTHDGGVVWSRAPLPAPQFSGAGGAQGVTFADALHGWTWTSAGMWATTDGGRHWSYQPVLGTVPHQ
jgi:hypothetical protein